MNRRTVLGVAMAATIVMAACSAAAAPSAAPASSAPAIAAPSDAPPSQAPTPAAPSVAPQSPTPAAVTGPQTIHVLEDPIAFSTIKAAGCTTSRGCVGDQLNGRSRMLDFATHTEVGTLLANCVMTDPSRNLYDCAIAITLNARGEILFDETVVIQGGGPQGPWPIISGTGEFLGATGSVSIPADSTWPYGDFVITITK